MGLKGAQYYLQRLRGEAPLAVLAAHHPLAAGVDAVRLEAVPGDARAALVVAVDRLEAAARRVVVDGGAGEVPPAVLARHQAALAREEHVVLHHEARDLGAAGVGARHRVLLARVEVRLQLVQRAGPRAALVLKSKDIDVFITYHENVALINRSD